MPRGRAPPFDGAFRNFKPQRGGRERGALRSGEHSVSAQSDSGREAHLRARLGRRRVTRSLPSRARKPQDSSRRVGDDAQPGLGLEDGYRRRYRSGEVA